MGAKWKDVGLSWRERQSGTTLNVGLSARKLADLDQQSLTCLDHVLGEALGLVSVLPQAAGPSRAGLAEGEIGRSRKVDCLRDVRLEQVG
jgi:hypothetical protein